MKGAVTKESTRLVLCVFSLPAATLFFLSPNIIFNFFFSLRLIRIYLGEVLLHVPQRAQEGHHGPVWPQIWRKNGEQVRSSKLNNKFRCLAKWPAESSLCQIESGFVTSDRMISVNLNSSLTCFQWELVSDNAVLYHYWWFLWTEFPGTCQTVESAIIGDHKILSLFGVDNIELMVSLMQWPSARSGADQHL